MLQLTFKRLPVYIAFLFILAGCGEGSDSSGSSSVSSEASVVPKGDGTALVSWTPPTENTDNSALTDLAGFKIHYGTFPGEYSKTITLNNPGLTSYLVEGLGASDWFFAITAFNSSNVQSEYSAEVFKTIN